MAPPTVYTVRYYNSYNTAAVILYPMVTAQSDPSSRIWNGRDESGQAWRQYDGGSSLFLLVSLPTSSRLLLLHSSN